MENSMFEIAAFVLSVFCIVFSLVARRKQYSVPKGFKGKIQSQHFLFLVLIFTNALTALSSLTETFLRNCTPPSTRPFVILALTVYFILHATLPVAFAIYILIVTGANRGRSPYFYNLFAAPYLIHEVLILLNFFTHLCFTVDENNVYHRGPLMPLMYALGGIYALFGLVAFFRHKRAVSKGDSIATAVFVAVAGVGVLIQAIFQDLAIELFAEALATLVLMVVLEEKSGHIDPGTGALNSNTSSRPSSCAIRRQSSRTRPVPPAYTSNRYSGCARCTAPNAFSAVSNPFSYSNLAAAQTISFRRSPTGTGSSDA
ncbi:MAG: hypothetical protein II797_03990, partial [Clostridia bacterium]|nr:hypothetical protein [Clostridia bacterium]